MVDSSVRILAGKLLCSSPTHESGLGNTQEPSSNIKEKQWQVIHEIQSLILKIHLLVPSLWTRPRSYSILYFQQCLVR